MKSIPIDVASALRHGEKNTQVIKDKAESLRAKLATDNLVSHAERRADARVATRINAVDIMIGASSLIDCPDFNHGDSAFNSTATELRYYGDSALIQLTVRRWRLLAAKKKDCGRSPGRTYTAAAYGPLIGSPSTIVGGFSGAGKVAFEKARG